MDKPFGADYRGGPCVVGPDPSPTHWHLMRFISSPDGRMVYNLWRAVDAEGEILLDVLGLVQSKRDKQPRESSCESCCRNTVSFPID